MKYSLFTVSVPEMTPEQALKKMKEYGYDGVDWRVTDLPTNPGTAKEAPSYWKNNYCTVDIATIDEKAQELKALSDRYGIKVNALATYLNCADSEARIESCMTAAVKMGCNRIRVNSLPYHKGQNYLETFEQAAAGFKKVEVLARKHGVKADFEMHMGTITPSASAAYRLACLFDPRNIGVIYDTGNVIYEGFEEYQMAFEILGPYLDLVHIKNACWVKKNVDGNEKYVPDWAPFTDGYADFERCFQALKAVGYDGYVTFEDFSSAESSEQKLKTDIDCIRRIVDAWSGRRRARMIRTFCTHEIRKVRELSGSLWEFSPCTGDLAGRKYRTAVPGCWESMPDFSSYRGVGVFSREIETEGAFRLVFKGVSHTARVCLDGREIGSHYNAYTPFAVAVTDVMAGRHLLEVYADNTFGEASALHIPNDYMSYGGISRGVLLEELTDTYIEYIHAVPVMEKDGWKAWFQ